jgi:hypothetical protein
MYSVCNLASHSLFSIVHSLSYIVKNLKDQLMNRLGLILSGYEESAAYRFLMLFSTAIKFTDYISVSFDSVTSSMPILEGNEAPSTRGGAWLQLVTPSSTGE